MNTFMREFRLLPVVLFATVSLLALKVGGLVLSGGYTLASPRHAQAQDSGTRAATPQHPPERPAERSAERSPERLTERSWAQETLGYPDFTASIDKPPEKEANGPQNGEAAKPGSAAPPAARPDGMPVAPENVRVSPAERAVLERLQERRQELDQRARELDIREGLLAAAERRLEARLLEVKEVEARINASFAKKDEAEIARFKSLVTMYENMKAKDAARIFDRLDARVLIEVASQMNPRRMSDVLAQMNSEAAQRLTVELATRSSQADRPPAFSDLPKIEGKPGG
jgi:flagellar motility protein MotE (MotC chaperone)